MRLRGLSFVDHRDVADFRRTSEGFVGALLVELDERFGG